MVVSGSNLRLRVQRQSKSWRWELTVIGLTSIVSRARERRKAAADAGVRSTGYKVIPDGGALATVGRLLDSGAVQVFVDRVFDLQDAADAHAEIERGHTRGKIVLRISDD